MQLVILESRHRVADSGGALAALEVTIPPRTSMAKMPERTNTQTISDCVHAVTAAATANVAAAVTTSTRPKTRNIASNRASAAAPRAMKTARSTSAPTMP